MPKKPPKMCLKALKQAALVSDMKLHPLDDPALGIRVNTGLFTAMLLGCFGRYGHDGNQPLQEVSQC